MQFDQEFEHHLLKYNFEYLNIPITMYRDKTSSDSVDI